MSAFGVACVVAACAGLSVGGVCAFVLFVWRREIGERVEVVSSDAARARARGADALAGLGRVEGRVGELEDWSRGTSEALLSVSECGGFVDRLGRVEDAVVALGDELAVLADVSAESYAELAEVVLPEAGLRAFAEYDEWLVRSGERVPCGGCGCGEQCEA